MGICIDAFAKHGSYRKAAKALRIPRTTFFDRWKKELATEAAGQKQAKIKNARVKKDDVKRYIFTCAVKGATVHEDFLLNLEAYAAYLGAEMVIGPLTNSSRQRFADLEEDDFPVELDGYLSDTPFLIADRVRFCPELNLTASTVKPLQGLQTFSKRHWGVFPHTKICLESVPTHKDRPAKINVTTGAVTHPHYSPTKAGFRAKFDHMYGAVIVEVSDKGAWMRHLVPTNDRDGTFYDLDRKVSDGVVDYYTGVSAIVYGDIHVEKLDPQCATATWGFDNFFEPALPEGYVSLVDLLTPAVHVIHDLMDNTAINYHEANDPFKLYQKFVDCDDNFPWQVRAASTFLRSLALLDGDVICVESNHDYFIDTWLKGPEPKDFVNLIEYHELKAAMYRNIRDRAGIGSLELALRMFGGHEKVCDDITFLKCDQSFEVHGVELGWHGHRGSNGSRGSRGSFKFVTEKSTTAHIHSAHIESGSHIVGTSSKLDLGYNKGPSSWSHTHGIIYPNGMRTLVTMSDDKFWADQQSATQD